MKTAPAHVMRSQYDSDFDARSAAASIDMSDQDDPRNRDTTHQEFKDETDINKILGRVGVDPNFPTRQRPFGEIDTTLDLQQALSVLDETNAGYNRLPENLKQIYPDWQSFYTALSKGEVQKVLEEHEKEARTRKEQEDMAHQLNREAALNRMRAEKQDLDEKEDRLKGQKGSTRKDPKE